MTIGLLAAGPQTRLRGHRLRASGAIPVAARPPLDPVVDALIYMIAQ